MTVVDKSGIGPVTTAPTKLAGRAQSVLGMSGPKISADEFVRDLKWGAVGNLPTEAIFDSQKYRVGKRKANEYVAGVLSKSIGFIGWGTASAVAGVAIAGLGLPAFAAGLIGFTAGSVGYDLFNRTFGQPLTRELAKRIPEQTAKPVANAYTRFVANPIHDWVWKPIANTWKDHKWVVVGLGGLLALRSPQSAWGLLKFGGTMIGGSIAAGVVGSQFNRVLPKTPDNY